jgi:membrane-bound lytic murein transglycosylase D
VEKPVLMNLLPLQLLAALLFLSGCASVSLETSPEPLTPPFSGEAVQMTPKVRPATPAPKTASPNFMAPSYPSGPLSSIDSTPTGSQSVAAMTPPVDLWERIRRGFAMPGLDNDLVRDREQWYSARPEYIFQMTERSRKYMFYIVEELERRNMPSELALLPFVESAFNPQAVSSAKAAGMWQFMPATGKTFDLKQNAFRDDRRDVLASTRAALDYLQKLYVMFGDWHLALAAYNWGEGSVGRAIAKNQRAGLGVGYTDLNMPMETRFYVPKLIALKNIVAKPAAFNSRLPLIENHPFFQTVDIKRDIDVALAAKLAEVSVDDFKALNPSASRPVILAAGTPQILLPWDNAAIFQRNLEAYSGGRLASWTVWLAPTTLKTAEVAKRVGMTEDALRALNNIPPRVVIKAGSSLLVPRTSHLETDVGVHVADNGQMSLGPDIVLKRTVIKAGKKDTVASLALRYGINASSLAEWNKTTPAASFKPGQAVTLFLAAAPRALVKNKPATKPKNAPVQAKAKNTTVRVAKK